MARIRTIKPEAFDDPDLNGLPFAARWLFIGLLTQADRAGRLVDDPRRLKVRLLPYDNVDLNGLLEKLADARFILRYRAGDSRYIQIRTFDRHQHPHVKEPESTIPAPCEHGADTGPEPDKHDASRVGREGKGREGNGVQEGDIAADAALPVQPADLVTLWNDHAQSTDVPTVKAVAGARLSTVRARLAEHPDLEWWTTYFARIFASDFLLGRSPRDAEHANWRPDFDWALKPGIVAKVLEGKYDNRAGPSKLTPATQRTLAGVDEWLAGAQGGAT